MTPRSGLVSLRAFRETDVAMAEELATDPYVRLVWGAASVVIGSAARSVS